MSEQQVATMAAIARIEPDKSTHGYSPGSILNELGFKNSDRVAQASLSRTLVRLESRGLIKRNKPAQYDRPESRIYFVTLTEIGLKDVNEIRVKLNKPQLEVKEVERKQPMSTLEFRQRIWAIETKTTLMNLQAQLIKLEPDQLRELRKSIDDRLDEMTRLIGEGTVSTC